MASVMKCDICGEIYKERSTEKWVKIQVVYDTGALPPTYIDACPACTKRILKYIDILKYRDGNYAIEVAPGEWLTPGCRLEKRRTCDD